MFTDSGRASFNKQHPELQPGEKFYSNFGSTEIAAQFMSDRPYRVGIQAYDREGRPQSGVPVFVPVK